jgi:hypothetical protein
MKVIGKITSPEIEQAISNVNAAVVEIAGNKDATLISPTTTKLVDLVYSTVAEVIGMIVMADPDALRGRSRKPSISRIAKQANKTGNPIEMKPDGSLVVMPKPTDQVGNTNLNEWDREYGTH